MKYVWLLFNQRGELHATFISPELAFRSLERSHGVGLVKVIHRGPGLWKINVKGNGELLCTRWMLHDKPIRI